MNAERSRAEAAPEASVQTVLGPVDPDSLGFTLPHEHVHARLWDFPTVAAVGYGGMYGEIHIEDDVRVVELEAFRVQGGRTVVDVTPPAIGRDPERLRRIAERTSLNIVMGCGWYREPYYPPEDLIDRRSVDELAAILVREITEGVGDTGIKPGIIGEIGVNNSWVTAQEERVHRAAARAQRATGLAITTHSPWSPIGVKELDIFEAEGVAPSRVVIGHACSYPVLEYYTTLLERGAYVQFDNIGQWDLPGYQDRVTGLILELLHRGHEGRIMLSHDVWNARAFAFAGGTGFTHLAENYLPELSEHGVGDNTIHTMTVENPKRMLTPVT
jgi:predicted metal-dependent phosphotriesterase family hydrolase